MQSLGDEKSGQICTVISSPGWVDGQTFSTPHRDYSVGGVPLVHNYGSVGSGFGTSGTLADWRKHVADPCFGHSLLMFSIAAFLASPLMKIMGLSTVGFNLVGPTSIGKSTVLRVGGSVWGGGGQHGFVRTWHSTMNANMVSFARGIRP
jgi:uncharacterized protein (DUF927 family)